MNPKISIDTGRCNGCGNCMIACPENASNNVELSGGKGAGGTDMSMAIVDGTAHLLNEKMCRRNFLTPPFKPCRHCLKSCPLSAVFFPEYEGFAFLLDRVVSKGDCSGCGLCVAICPEKAVGMDELPELRGECTNCGYCTAQCPRVHLLERELETALFGPYVDGPLGHCEAKVAARSKVGSILDRGQDGGFVTTLLKYALESRIIDGAIVAGVDPADPWRPMPLLATNPDEILAGAGSKYSNSPNLALLRAAEEEGLRSLAVVGLPCHIQGLRKVESQPIEDMDLGRLVKLSIGLFCMSNFEYYGLKNLIEERCDCSIGEVRKCVIKKGFFVVDGPGETIKIPLAETLSHKRDGCMGCEDFTSRLSDFSIGSAGSPEGYSTVFARTRLATEILDGMRALDLVTIRGLEAGSPGIETICSLVRKKEQGAEEARVLRIMRRGLPALPRGGEVAVEQAPTAFSKG